MSNKYAYNFTKYKLMKIIMVNFKNCIHTVQKEYSIYINIFFLFSINTFLY